MSQQTFPSQLASYSDLFQRMLDYVLILDPHEFTILDANPLAEKAFGQPREALGGRKFLDWVQESDRERIAQAFRIARRRYHPRSVTADMKLPNSPCPAHVDMLVCMLQVAGQAELLQIIAKDVTEVFKANQRAEQYYKELIQLNQKLEELAVTDELTQLANRRQFKNQLTQIHKSAKRYKRKYSIIFIDIDHFKNYNDRNGHQAGDHLLANLGRILVQSSRSVDIPARYGGEEFVILTPESPWEGACIHAERIRSAVEKYPFAFREHQPLGRVTVSIGVAGFPNDGETDEDVLRAADAALYASKSSGRNKVTSSHELRHGKTPGDLG